jgi:hypothetical protein
MSSLRCVTNDRPGVWLVVFVQNNQSEAVIYGRNDYTRSRRPRDVPKAMLTVSGIRWLTVSVVVF